MTNMSPKTAIPPARLSIRKSVIPASFGIEALTTDMMISMTIGNAAQKI